MKWRARSWLLSAIFVILALLHPAQAADPDALWHIVHNYCVPDQQEHADPAPCAKADLRGGYVVLKDARGATQYLLIPTDRVTGIEDPALLRPDAPNYFADAWRERGFTEQAVGHPLPPDSVSLAVNSIYGRSQNQLHIHIDCLRPEVRDALRARAATVGESWAPFGDLAHHPYWAMRISGTELGDANPFKLLASGKPGAAVAMAEQTLVVAPVEFGPGQPGFILLAGQHDAAHGNRGNGEELQDHSCAVARP